MQDLMIDLETLDVLPTALILQVGLVRFDADSNSPVAGPDTNPDIELYNVELKGQDGTWSEQTLRWWMNQSDSARKGLETPATLPISQVLGRVQVLAQDKKVTRVWSHGAAFDHPIVIYHLNKLGMGEMCSYRKLRCTRTLFDLFVMERTNPQILHRADWDAWAQAEDVRRIYQIK